MAERLTVSSSFPRVEGSGIGPSITHRLDSYLVRIKFSILLDHYEPPKIFKTKGRQGKLTIRREHDQAPV